MCDAARAYDSGQAGRELVESFVPAFEPKPHHTGVQRLRARYHFWLQAGYSGLFMLPWNRRRYDIPTAAPGIAMLLVQAPAVAAMELLRRLSPAVDRRWQRWSYNRWDRWARWQAAGMSAEFEAGKQLRR
jgi:hypothetical protein